jgi:glycerophosphoryl diester phosphodiesterase
MNTINRKICAHRGFNTAAPENSIPAFAMAIALGADEIEFDLWPTADGEIIVTHDPSVDRTSNGHGNIWELSYREVSEFDAGSHFSEKFAGLGFLRFDTLMEKFARRTVMNIHIKSVPDGRNNGDYDEELFEKIVSTIKRFGAERYVYIAGAEDVLKTALKVAPELSRCCLTGRSSGTVVDRAIEYGCERLQFSKKYFTPEQLEKAHKNNIVCNMFWADDPEEAVSFFNAGIDTVLTNNFWPVKYAAVKAGILQP